MPESASNQTFFKLTAQGSDTKFNPTIPLVCAAIFFMAYATMTIMIAADFSANQNAKLNAVLENNVRPPVQ